MLLTLTGVRQKSPYALAHTGRAYLRPEEESGIRFPYEILEHLPVSPSGYDKGLLYVCQSRAQRIYRVRVLVVCGANSRVQELGNLPFGHTRGTEKLCARLGSQV